MTPKGKDYGNPCKKLRVVYMKAIFNYLWISGTHYNTAEGGADQNQMVLDVREGAVKIFHFAEVINE